MSPRGCVLSYLFLILLLLLLLRHHQEGERSKAPTRQFRFGAAEKVSGKVEKEAQMFEPKASFCASPLCRSLFREKGFALASANRSAGGQQCCPNSLLPPPKGQRLCGRLLLLTFLGETRKVSGCRAAPGLSQQVEH
jgi:hypothetical protein